MQFNPLLEHPAPDFAELRRVLMGEQLPKRVHLVEWAIDGEILQAIASRYLAQPLTITSIDDIYRGLVTLHYRLGFDYVMIYHVHNFLNQPRMAWSSVDDTAILSRGQRRMVTSETGIIKSWDDFDRIRWDEIKPNYAPWGPVLEMLPKGMKVVVGACFVQNFTDVLFGYEGLSYLLYDNPELVRACIERWGEITCNFIKEVAARDEVGAVFVADDLGFKTGTFFAPKVYSDLFLPWHQRMSELTHEQGKMFWLHCCGNIYANKTIELILNEVKIDALHSYQDTILPVGDFRSRYGDRAASLGGVDMDKLVRMDEESLRHYVRGILDTCMPGGRYAFGSGNTITNYTPLENFFIMLDEARKWEPGRATV